jgi:hypothetical protein
MSKQAHFKRDFVEQMDGGRSRRYPGGWRGLVSEKTFAAADQAGALRSSAVAPIVVNDNFETGEMLKMSRADLDEKLREANLDPADFKKKADAMAALSKE